MEKQVIAKITEQQTGKENTPVFYVGEQLKEICSRYPGAAEIILTDLNNPDMSIVAAEKRIKAYADENKGSARSFCVSPAVAEKILCEFYGIHTEAATTPKLTNSFIDLEDFI